MIKPYLCSVLLGALALPIQAHELWLERTDNGPVKLYLGEPDEGVIERGDTIANLAPNTRFFIKDSESKAAVSVRDDHLEAAVDAQSDIRAINDQVWKPWKNEDGQVVAPLMHARFGRSETNAHMDLELVPVAAGGDRFTLMFKSKPLAEQDVMLITPDNKAVELKTDSKGQVQAPIEQPGRYILAGHHEAPAEGQKRNGEAVDTLFYGTTTSFVAQ